MQGRQVDIGSFNFKFGEKYDFFTTPFINESLIFKILNWDSSVTIENIFLLIAYM